eukprot:Plantae.Rhodophyta-Purpureofilum_apyrenoidigerum.ctg6444.p1 GENE.Plantae.Rhodophyta-Purpureofilum_apyrenoidigerum.ctg6444~~Plantae.Rhodophyta-Purpureofilum_apyrenoidigerum.ctg6444.p1  ORF type:complete len:159 (+),score=35.24 Plantae.Rhodophyta-Purpureofilum_apyrenoidigerum.ctg6444:126-602(+)
MGDIDVDPPFDPQVIPGDKSVITRFCENPINSRVEWIEAKVSTKNLHTGTEISDDVKEYVMDGDTRKGDKPCMVIAKSLGGDGDATYNVFARGKSFDLATFQNETESMVYHFVKDTGSTALIRVKFHFKNNDTVRPYKVLYVVELDSGDTIENELLNV